MATVMALKMVLAILAATVSIGMQLHLRMMLPAQSFGMYIRSHDNVAQHEQEGKESSGESAHSEAILLKNRVLGKRRAYKIAASIEKAQSSNIKV